ncbi:hypothetical protein XELAEV_18033534mg [Xenopus laevis]|uniref:Uncharacterized protein n=1 Tax=Xenopus laevis TaxID=8355 RepID=A0A974HEI3_XENLA|nr:hypothetical protein XELAEV_18033534mg [Xenopus laevis]
MAATPLDNGTDSNLLHFLFPLQWLLFQYTGSGRLHINLKCLELGRDATELQKECSNTASQQWRAKSSFLLEKPHTENVKIKVKGKGHGILGSFTLHISDLLLAENLTIEGWHQLEAPFPQGTIWIRFELWILVPPGDSLMVQCS